MKRYFFQTFLLGAAIALTGHAALAQTTGPFTQAQVTTGHKNFQAYCAACHGDNLAGGGEVPPLTGAIFSHDWFGGTMGSFFAYISNAMPQGLEGELKPEEYVAITAYVMAANGAKPGTTPFTGKSDVKIGTITDGKIVPSVVNAAVK